MIAFDLNWGSVSTQGSEHSLDGKKYPAELQIRLFNQKYQGESSCKISSDCGAILSFLFEVSTILITLYYTVITIKIFNHKIDFFFLNCLDL